MHNFPFTLSLLVVDGVVDHHSLVTDRTTPSTNSATLSRYCIPGICGAQPFAIIRPWDIGSTLRYRDLGYESVEEFTSVADDDDASAENVHSFLQNAYFRTFCGPIPCKGQP